MAGWPLSVPTAVAIVQALAYTSLLLGPASGGATGVLCIGGGGGGGGDPNRVRRGDGGVH